MGFMLKCDKSIDFSDKVCYNESRHLGSVVLTPRCTIKNSEVLCNERGFNCRN